MNILETERLNLSEMNAVDDAEFILELLNTPKFIKYIGDRGVRTVADAADLIEKRYRPSYSENGFGFYTVRLKTGQPIGICGFLKRDSLPGPDVGFALLPEFERRGFGFEAANAVMKLGRDSFGLKRVLAITSPENDVSGRLLKKLGFHFDTLMDAPDGDKLKVFVCETS